MLQDELVTRVLPTLVDSNSFLLANMYLSPLSLLVHDCKELSNTQEGGGRLDKNKFCHRCHDFDMTLVKLNHTKLTQFTEIASTAIFWLPQ